MLPTALMFKMLALLPEGLLPGPCSSGGYAEDSNHHPRRDVLVPTHAVWSSQQWQHVSVPDNILIFSRDLSSHIDNLREVFLIFRNHSQMMGLPNCEFAVSKIKLLGHLSATGCYPPS